MFREKNNRNRTTNYYIHVQYFLICIYQQKTYWLASKYLIIFSNLHSFFSKFSFMILFYVDFSKVYYFFFT